LKSRLKLSGQSNRTVTLRAGGLPSLGGHMKAISLVAPTLMLSVLTTAALSQSARTDNAPKSGGQQSAELAFARLATLAGNWTGQAGMADQPGMSAPMRVSLRVTSGGSALLQEMLPEGRPDDPSNGANDPITMLYVEDGRLILLMYCDGGKNRARLAGTLSSDGKTATFDFLDVSGGTKYGYMHHAVFTFIDTDHHSEDWTYMMPGGKPVQGHVDLVRAKRA
jgi:hypothetical protein